MARPKLTTSPNRRHQILEQAAGLFKTNGFNATTMRQLAEQTGMEAASLYNHIKSKQEILVLIVIEIAEEFTNTMLQIVNSDETTIQKLEKVIQLHIDITLRNPDALACLNNDWMHLADAELTYFIKMREEYEANFRTIIKHGIANHEIKNLNIEVIIFSTLSTLQTLYLWYGKKKSPNATVLKSNMIEVLLNEII